METATAHRSAMADLPSIPALPTGAPTLAKQLKYWMEIAHRNWVHLPSCEAEEAAEMSAMMVTGIAALTNVQAVPPPTVELEGKTYWREPEGSLVPASLVKPAKLLEDDFVRTVVSGALSVSGSISRFKSLSFCEAQALLDTLAQDYGAKMGGVKGNVSFYSFDREWLVEIRVQERIAVNVGIEIAKSLLNEWLSEAEASDEVKAVINRVFALDDQGRVRVAELVRLRGYEIRHPKWTAALRAINEAMETVGKTEYLSVKRRNGKGRYDRIPLDLPSA